MTSRSHRSRPAELRERVLAALRADPHRSWTSSELALEVHSNRLSIAEVLRGLRPDGLVTVAGKRRLLWRLAGGSS